MTATVLSSYHCHEDEPAPQIIIFTLAGKSYLNAFVFHLIFHCTLQLLGRTTVTCFFPLFSAQSICRDATKGSVNNRNISHFPDREDVRRKKSDMLRIY